MDGRAASLTVTDKIPYLLKEGIQLHVLSAITGSKDTRFPHQQLIAWGPAAFRFDFRHWFANRFGRNIAYKIITPLVSAILAPFILIEKLLFGYSSQWSWAFPAYFNGLKLINEGKVNLVYSSGGAWSAHLAGLWLKKKTKIPDLDLDDSSDLDFGDFRCHWNTLFQRTLTEIRNIPKMKNIKYTQREKIWHNLASVSMVYFLSSSA